MTSRDDSLLTWKHVNRFPTQTRNDEKVAKELVAVDFIHNATNYQHLVEDVMRLAAHYLVEKHQFQWGDAYKLCRKYIPDMIKLYCLYNENKTIPEFVV